MTNKELRNYIIEHVIIALLLGLIVLGITHFIELNKVKDNTDKIQQDIEDINNTISGSLSSINAANSSINENLSSIQQNTQTIADQLKIDIISVENR